MLRAINEAIGHQGVGFVDGMKPCIAELHIPEGTDLVTHFRLKSCDLRLPDVLGAVDHIGRAHPFGTFAKLRRKIHISARKVDAHIVANAVVEDAETRSSILRLSFDAHVDIEGLLRLELGIAFPPPAHLRDADADGIAAVHLPVVPKLAHARLRIARADVRLEATMRIAADVVRDAEVARDIRAKETAVIEAQNRREDRVFRHLPCIADEKIVALNRTAAHRDALIAAPVFFEECFSVEFGGIRILILATLEIFFNDVCA